MNRSIREIIPVIVALLGTACPLVTEGTASDDTTGENYEAVAADARCGAPIPCDSPSEDGAGTETGDGDVGEAEEDEESEGSSSSSDSQGSESEGTDSSSSDVGTESTGEPAPGFDPCSEPCEPYEFTSNEGACTCAPFCLSVEDCPEGGQCIAGVGCYLPCASSADCPSGMSCEVWGYSGTYGNACFWPNGGA